MKLQVTQENVGQWIACGKAPASCAQTPGLRTSLVLGFMGAVRKLGGFAASCRQVVRPLMHRDFASFQSVSSLLMPIIPSPNKKDNKRIYINFYTYIGASS